MGWIRRMLAGERNPLWLEYCRQSGAHYIRGSGSHGDRVILRLGPWHATVDTHGHLEHLPVEGVGRCTRVRAPYYHEDGFRFECRPHPPATFREPEDVQHVEAGFPELDRTYVFRTNDPDRLRALFDHDRLRELLASSAVGRLAIDFREGSVHNRLPAGVHQVTCMAACHPDSVDELKDLVEIVDHALERLAQLGSAKREGPNLSL